MTPKRSLWIVAAGALVAALALFSAPEPTTSFIIQGDDAAELAALVESTGGDVTHELGIIDSVAANLTEAQLDRIEASPMVLRIVENVVATVAAKKKKKRSASLDVATLDASTETMPVDSDDAIQGYDSSVLVSAPSLHELGLTGTGVTVAVMDTGVVNWNDLAWDKNSGRIHVQYDALRDRQLRGGSYTDENGHGTHLSSVIMNSSDDNGLHIGLAPEASLVVVKAFDAKGRGTYADVIRGLDWVVANQDRYGIRVLNLSFSAPPRAHYWEDPVNQAVMRAWQAGIVVVASAGNTGPSPMTVGVPGNVPYVITVGAMTDNYTPSDRGDDRLAKFTAAGPTAERFVKPDIVAPGGHIKALMEKTLTIAQKHPEFHDGGRYFTMSGTSQAAAVVTGVVALLLQHDPSLTPDDVKCRLMAGAHPAVNADGTLTYSVFQQGAGLVNAYDAVFNAATGCANAGMDIEKDLDGAEHYAGAARMTEDGSYYIEGIDGSLWSGSMLWHDSFLWSDSMLWHDSFLWNDSMLWHDSFLWNDSMLWHDSFLWNDSMLWHDSFLWNDSIAINHWVDQQ